MKSKEAKKGFWQKLLWGRFSKVRIDKVLFLALIGLVLSQNASINSRIDALYVLMREEFRALNRRIDEHIQSAPHLKSNNEIKDRKIEENENSVNSPEKKPEDTGSNLYDGEDLLSDTDESGGKE